MDTPTRVMRESLSTSVFRSMYSRSAQRLFAIDRQSGTFSSHGLHSSLEDGEILLHSILCGGTIVSYQEQTT